MDRFGTQIGLFRQATITKYNNDGTVVIGLDEASMVGTPAEYKVGIPAAWLGQEGEFLGGYPRVGSSVVAAQGHGGKWYIVSYIPSNLVFDNTSGSTVSSINRNRMAVLRPGRIVGQVKDGTRFFIDPDVGIQAGRPNNFLHLDSKLNIITHNFQQALSFTDASRSINGTVRRDLIENSNRNIINSTLDSTAYDKSLSEIGMDPTVISTPTSVGNNIRNPALVENREVVYEFAHSDYFTTDEVEASRYTDPSIQPDRLKVDRKEMRGDALSLNLQAPNHLIETIKGTAVDLFGNIVDINRDILPIGKIPLISLAGNPDKADAFKRIRAQLRKSIAYHFEINARKGTQDPNAITPPDVTKAVDYLRDRSRFSFDIDKEGQFKLNVPSSSAIGNIPLCTRHENFSVLKASTDDTLDPNAFLRGADNKEIYLENFSSNPIIKLSNGDPVFDGYSAPTDRNTGKPMTYGTAYHDITKTCSEFQKTAGWVVAGKKVVPFDVNNRLNTMITPLDKIVSDTIIVDGATANAGGRSGAINLDGFISLNIGANQIDKQSVWFDYAGSVIGNIGRDLQGISYAATMDGDLLLQVGGNTVANTFDSRFPTANDSFRPATVEIRVLCNNQFMIFRMAQEGISLISPGTITMSAQQDIILRSNSNILVEGKSIVMHAETSKRIINKGTKNTI